MRLPESGFKWSFYKTDGFRSAFAYDGKCWEAVCHVMEGFDAAEGSGSGY